MKNKKLSFKSSGLKEKTMKRPAIHEEHIGKALHMVSNPDEIEDHIPEYCSCCGRDLRNEECKLIEKRQIADIPEIKMKITEHRIYEKKCDCEQVTVSSCNKGMKNKIMYGNNFESQVLSFAANQHIPFNRLQEILSELFNKY